MTAPRFGVWAPVYGNHGARNHPADTPDAGYRRNRDLLVRAERAGFDSTLLAQHVIHPSNVDDDVLETWSTLAALAEATSRIELIGAIKPLLINPLVFAKLAGNIADISGGRLAINVVSGWFLPELEALGLDAADHDDRYAYAHDFPGAVVPGETYLPDEIANEVLYEPVDRGEEARIKARLAELRSATRKPPSE